MGYLMDNSLFKVFNNTADGVFIIDEDQRIIYWNQAAQDILGYTSNEVIGQPCHKILRGCDDQGQAICHHDCYVSMDALMGRAVTNYNLATHTKSGKTCWINISILTFSPSDNGSGPVVVHLFRDATKTKQNEQFIHQMFDAVEHWQKTTVPTMPSAPARSHTEVLTDREREVLSLLAQGFGTAEIARSLSISSNTVRNHIQNILHKLQVHSRLEAVSYAFKNGLVAKE